MNSDEEIRLARRDRKTFLHRSASAFISVAHFCLLLFLILLATGCARSVSFDISVKNTTTDPLTMGTVKYGSPLESTWASPEDIAIGSPGRPDARWGVVVAPGDLASLHITGHFAGGAAAFLRIYTGDLNLSHLLATSQRNPGRVDLPLYSGVNSFVVRVRDGKLFAERLAKTESPSHGS